MATATKAGPKPIPHASGLSGLTRASVHYGLLDELEAQALMHAARSAHAEFVEQLTLTRAGRLPALEGAGFAAQTFDHPRLDLDAYDPARLADTLVDAKLMQAQRVRGKRLALAICDPSRGETLEDVKFHAGLSVDPVGVEDDEFGRLIELGVNSCPLVLYSLSGDDFGLEFAQESTEASPAAALVVDAPVVCFIQRVRVDAILGGASDIHFEPYEKRYRVRARVDGELREVANPLALLKDKLATRRKVTSRLKISEKRTPQDLRMKLVLANAHAVDFRVSTLPTLFGEKVCPHVLNPSAFNLDTSSPGYGPEQMAALLEAVHRAYGMVLLPGQTESGRAVSLYSCLDVRSVPGTNVPTVENPAEINLSGVNRVSVDDRAGLGFATAQRAFLRQDPHIIMVGEIRDLETAQIAITAAQTEHFVLSSVLTNDAPSKLTRLVNIGIAPFNIASSVNLITAPGLARGLCSCKRSANLPPEASPEAGFTEDEIEEGRAAYAPVGCEQSKGRGYHGRVGIYQVTPISDEIRRLRRRARRSPASARRGHYRLATRRIAESKARRDFAGGSHGLQQRLTLALARRSREPAWRVTGTLSEQWQRPRQRSLRRCS